MKETQCKRIIRYLEEFGSISTLQAFADLGVARLASRIHDLRKQGYAFRTSTGTALNRYGEVTHYKIYRLAEDQPAALVAVGSKEAYNG